MRFRKWLLRALVDPLLPGRVPEDPYRARGIASILLFTFFSAGFVVFTEAPLIGSWALRIIFFAMLVPGCRQILIGNASESASSSTQTTP